MAPKPKKKGRVLIVDDEEVIRRLLERHLGDSGWEAVTAADAFEALALLKRKPFDLVLLDNNLPRLTGLQALPKIAALTRAPVIMITGFPNAETYNSALLLGAKSLLLKPVSLDELDEKIAEALKAG